MPDDSDMARLTDATRGPWAGSSTTERVLFLEAAEGGGTSRRNRNAFMALGDLLTNARPRGDNAALLAVLERRLEEEGRALAPIRGGRARRQRAWPALVAASILFAACLVGLAVIPGPQNELPEHDATTASAVAPWVDDFDRHMVTFESLLAEVDAPVSVAGEFETLSDSIASTTKELESQVW